MSRTKAKANLSMDEYRETMKGIYTTSINENTLDEAPMAYKSLEDIIDVFLHLQKQKRRKKCLLCLPSIW